MYRQRADVERASQLMINCSDPFTSDNRKPLLHSGHFMDTSSGHLRASISSVHDNVVSHTVSHGASSSAKVIPGFLPNPGCDRLRKSGDSQCSSNQLGVVDSMELIEKDYVLVDPHFASVESLSLSYYLETSLQASYPTRISNYPSKKNDQGLAISIGTKGVGALSSNVAETLQVHSPSSLITSSESTMSMEVQRPNFLHPSSRLYFLHQCVRALEELAQDKYKAGELLESFSVELVVLAIWKKVYEISGSWMSSREEGKLPGTYSAKESAVNLEGTSLAPRSEGNVDFINPLSVYMWAEQGFIVACDRAEQLSDHFRNMDATAEMPDAMEIIYQKALALGKAGCVDELMDNKSSAAALYSKAMFLLSFIMGEAATLPLNPPLLLTLDSKKQIENFIMVLQSRQMHFLTSPRSTERSPKPLTK
ncbi:serine/threonine-protein kinase ATG1a-like isoform X1 [Carica papaya]|uniref:serine/threonine-protein kinase ATG1a-like isoform X1 n=1 Tax=Carica papaya TaxID=3649 RepID=UPI000B8C8FA3|nr:serine/threonine-protein kinase ATG1a-like isoform X1 [Carica papaya]